MSEVRGYIDLVDDGIVSGWIVSNESSEVSLFCGENNLGSLNELSYRQDIVNAGYSEGNTGFDFDARVFVKNISGPQLFSIQVDGKIITEKEFYLPTGTNYILNPFMELEGQFALKNTIINSNHRIGIDFNSFIAPAGLQHSNGKYTRIAFADLNNTKSTLELSINLDPSVIDEGKKHPLEFSFVGKSSNPCNIHVRWLDDNDQCVLDVPILIDQDWALKTCVFDTELTERVRLGELRLVLRAKHHGRRNIDIAMAVLVENTSLFKIPVQEEKIQRAIDDSLYDDSLYKGNLLQNGELSKWSKGIDFSLLARGQELADNWFFEMNKSNLGNVQVAVSVNNIGQDPLANSFQPRFGLRMRTKKLNGYARVICPLNSTSINVINYTLVMEIEATSLNKVTVMPRVYFIARNAYEDVVVMDVARKVTICGRQYLSFDLSSYQIDELLTRIGKMPVLALAIDLAPNTDITVHSASFKVADFSSEEQQEKNNVTNDVICFEDESITEQLHLLKGLDSWGAGEVKAIDNHQAKQKNEPFILEGAEFKKAIHNLKPHNMTRPSRHFPFIDIIIPVYNACDDVLLCLSSLIEKTDLAHRIIIVNDGDEERTTKMLQTFESSFHHVKILNNLENIGYTKSVNRGIKCSNAGWVVVLNSDTIVSEGWLGRLMNCALSSDKIGMVGPLSNAASWQSIPEIHDKNGDWHLNPLPEGMLVDHFSKLVEQHSVREYPEVGVINGFCQLINMELLDEIGLLDEVAFPIGYGEENDMCARAVKAGYKLLIADDTYVFHSKSKSFGHDQRKKLAKRGSEALKKKHPDVNWSEVTKLIRENSAVNTLREQLSEQLQKFKSEVK